MKFDIGDRAARILVPVIMLLMMCALGYAVFEGAGAAIDIFLGRDVRMYAVAVFLVSISWFSGMFSGMGIQADQEGQPRYGWVASHGTNHKLWPMGAVLAVVCVVFLFLHRDNWHNWPTFVDVVGKLFLCLWVWIFVVIAPWMFFVRSHGIHKRRD